MKKFNVIVISLLIFVWSASLLSSFVQASTKQFEQSCTAYLATGKKMANGEWPKIGDVAVHPSVKGGSTPIIPYGTYLIIDLICSQDGLYDDYWHSPEGDIGALKVGDLGDVKYDRGFTKYWVDLYYGDYTTEANAWGLGKIYYHYD